MSKRHIGPEEAYVALCKMGIMILGTMLRVLIGQRRRQFVQNRLGLHYPRAESVRQGCFLIGYEPQVQKVMRSKLKRGGTFLDIGGNVGAHAAYANRLVGREGRIIVVEPDPSNFDILTNSNGECRNVHLIQKAVWIEDGESPFTLGIRVYDEDQSKTHSYFGSLTPTPEHFSKGFVLGPREKVSTIRLDTLLDEIGSGIIDLAKIDIEGSEYEVFADPKLDLSRIKNLIVEVHGKYPSRGVHEFMMNLKGRGFKVSPLAIREMDNVHILAENNLLMPY